MKIKFRVSTEELANLCKEMSDFLGSHKYERGFQRFEICNQIKEEGYFTFDLNVVAGFDHGSKKWVRGAVTEIELSPQKAICLECIANNVCKKYTEKKVDDRE